jgi:hypothetical protein
MRKSFLSCLAVSTTIGLFCPQTGVARNDVPLLVPSPKEVQWSNEPGLELADGAVAIVIGDNASDPAKAAADLLHRRVSKRFGQTWPIVVEGGDWKKASVIVLLGERSTNGWLDRLCSQRQIDLSESSPGFDGYVIDVFSAEGRTIALVGGCNARGTLYGQDTLFQLLARQDGKTVLRPTFVRDWPTVPWRGRPQTTVAAHLQPGMMDVYAISRVNFIDLRNGTYAFEPDYVLTDKDKADIAEVIRLAHQRDIVVFGTVNCGVPRSKYDAVMAQFKQFLSLGVDGLWPSFDDKGPGEAPEELVAKVIALGKQHEIAGNRIAITPPKGSYQVIAAPFNAKIMKVAGMEQALWFWTPIPSAEALEAARSIGLKTKMSWWHNWPRPGSGFTHISGGSVLGGGKRAYMEVPPMACGWHEPTDEELAADGRNVQAVMPWGGNAWEPYYIVPIVNWWGWSPEQPDFKGVRRRIYSIVFGPSSVDAAAEFDDVLVQAKRLFVYAPEKGGGRPPALARLKSVADRAGAVALVERLDRLLPRVEEQAGRETMLDAEQLRRNLLDPMAAEVRAARAAATLAYPEYWWDEHQRKVLDAVYAGDTKRADELTAAVRDRVTGELNGIGKALGFLGITRAYVDWWTQRAGLNAQGWQALIDERRAEVPRRADHYGYYAVKISDLLRGLAHPPREWGRGKADRQLHILATAMPGSQEQFRGEWVGGLYGKGAPVAALFALAKDSGCNAGDYSELPVTVPVSGPRDRLGLLVFMNRHTKDAFGLEESPGRWAGFASVQLLWGDRILWEGDVGLPRDGRPWDLVRLPVIPDNVSELALRLRVQDRKDSQGMQAIVFVGPIRLVEVP